MKKDFAFLSRPHSQTVCGITVRKLSIGEYIDKAALISETLEALLDSLFPGATAVGIVRALARIEAEELKALLRRAMLSAPSALIGLAAALLDADKEKLSALSPYELLMVLSQFERENRITDFLHAVRELAARGRTATATGSKG